MKKYLLFLLLLISTMVCFGQSDSTITVTYTVGNSLADFLKNNYPTIVAFLMWLIFEYWLGRTNKVKAGSTLEAILNFIKMIISKFVLKK